MELRKLISFGNSSFIVSIPKAWVERNRLKKGDFLSMDERGHEIVISSHDAGERRTFKETIVDSGSKSVDELNAEITSAYISNYDIITVKNVMNGEMHRNIKNIFRRLVGMEIIEETSSKIVAKDLLEITEVSIDKLIRRMDIIARSMLLDTLIVEKGSFESLYDRDEEVNKLALLAFRTVRAAFDNPRVMKIFNLNLIKLASLRQMADILEIVADQTKRISKAINIEKADKKILADLKETYGAISKRYLDVMKIYYSDDLASAYRAEKDVKDMVRLCDAFARKHKDASSVKIAEYLRRMVANLTFILRNLMESRE